MARPKCNLPKVPQILFAAALAILLPCSAPADTAGPTVSLTEGRRPRIAADTAKSGVFHVVVEKSDSVLYCQSSEGGRTWSPPIRLPSGAAHDPSVSVEPGGVVDVVWSEASQGHASDIFLSRSVDSGRTWGPPINVSSTPGISSQPIVAAGPEHSIHVVWLDTTGDGRTPQVWYRTSQDGGRVWSTSINLSQSLGPCQDPFVAVDSSDGNVHVVWVGSELGNQARHVRCADGSRGLWSQGALIARSDSAAHPRATCGPSGKVIVTWKDQSQIAYTSAALMGGFGDVSKLLGQVDADSAPAIVADQEGRVVLTWVEASSASLAYAVSRNRLNLSFSAAANVTSGKTACPDLALQGSKLCVVWEEGGAVKAGSIDLGANLKDPDSGLRKPKSPLPKKKNDLR